MSVLRFAVLIAAVFVLVPADNEQRQRLWKQSQNVATWAMTACERNPNSCKQAEQVWARVKEKSAKSVALLNDMVHEQMSSPYAISNSFEGDFITGSILSSTSGTLSQADLIPDWRGQLPALK